MKLDDLLRSNRSLTQAELFYAVDKIRAAFKAAETKANRNYAAEKRRIYDRLMFRQQRDDVIDAARENAYRRAEIAFDAAIERAFTKRDKQYDVLRGLAGEWEEIVPASRRAQ